MLSANRRIIAFVGLWLLLVVLVLAWPLKGLKKMKSLSYSLDIRDRNGEILRTLPLDQGLRRIYLDTATLPDATIRVILDCEDRRFYVHPGVDPLALFRAMAGNWQSGTIQSGASTLTMQLTRIMNPGYRGYWGKLQEITRALRLDARLGKKKVLRYYLNLLPFGRNLEGLEAASRFYLDKGAAQLNPAETLVLMMIPRSPEAYDPLVYPQENLQACLRTLPRLRTPVSENEIEEVLYKIAELGGKPWEWEAPHFVLWVDEQISDSQRQRGEDIQTTLDLTLQHRLEQNIADKVMMARENRISNGAGMIVDSQNGEILAYTGSVDFWDSQLSGQIDGVQILRQPGSTLKPFLYTLALDMGFSPVTVLPDIPMEFGGAQVYIPENYNERFNGPVLLSVALASSLNVPAVYMLERLGVEHFTRILMSLGIQSLDPREGQYGLGLALGNAEISLYELIQAYRVFCSGGVYSPLIFQKEQEPSLKTEVFSASSTQLIRDILSEPMNRILGFGRNSFLNKDYDAFFKTGTSSQFNNIWAVGGTSDLLCAVWMGNFAGETVIGTPGSSIPASVVSEILDSTAPHSDYADYAEMESLSICSLSGMALTEHCSNQISQLFPKGTELEPCSWHTAEGGVEYPGEYRQWLERRGIETDLNYSSMETAITEPLKGSLYYYDPTMPIQSQQIKIELTGQGTGILFLNGKILYSGELPVTLFIPLEEGTHILELESENQRDSADFRVLF